MLHDPARNDRAILLQFQNDIQRETHPRTGSKISMNGRRIYSGLFQCKFTVSGSMRDTGPGRYPVDVEQKSISRSSGSRRSRISGKKLCCRSRASCPRCTCGARRTSRSRYPRRTSRTCCARCSRCARCARRAVYLCTTLDFPLF